MDVGHASCLNRASPSGVKIVDDAVITPPSHKLLSILPTENLLSHDILYLVLQKFSPAGTLTATAAVARIRTMEDKKALHLILGF